MLPLKALLYKYYYSTTYTTATTYHTVYERRTCLHFIKFYLDFNGL